MGHQDRVVILVDMDCFYCQVEEKLDPNLAGKPIAVVQYNQWQGGGIIAVNYPAREQGVTRHMRGNEAKEKCPDIELVRVPNVRGKADLTKYREAGKRVAEVLQTFSALLERASVDEAYLDVTELVNNRLSNNKAVQADDLRNTHIVGFDNVQVFLYEVYEGEYLTDSNLKLAMGGVIAEEIRAAVYEKTGYKCSAGIAHNKILSKLVCGLHKPNQQTILTQEGITELYETLPIRKIRSLGGKFGEHVADKLNITNMGELIRFTEADLSKLFDEKAAKWLYNIARGIDNEPVTIRLVAKSIGCCKKFPGKSALCDDAAIKHWLGELTLEISERLQKDQEENNRKAKQLVIGFTQGIRGRDVSNSRSIALNSYESNRIMDDAYEVIKKNCRKSDGSFHVKYLAVNVGKFEENKNVVDISTFFKQKENKNDLNDKNKLNGTNCEKINENNSINKENGLINIENGLINKENVLINTEDDVINKEFDLINKMNDKSVDHCDEDSNDSISQEIKAEKTPLSFFQQYIENLKEKSPVDRNFDTSINLQCNNEEEDSEIIVDNIVSVPSTSKLLTDSKQTCPECNKKIAEDEMTSHIDYHYALRIVREEADLYKTQKADEKSVNKKDAIKSPKKGNKRKLNASTNCQKLTTFLVRKDANVPTEKCSECNKDVPIEELINHMDYHLAKRLHLEMNTQIVQPKVEVKRRVHDKNMPTISTYFKPV